MTPEEYIDKMAFMTAGENYAVMYEDARKAVNMAKSTWIEVEDRLPEAGKTVLVLFKFEDYYLIMEDIRTNAQTKDNWYHGKSKVIAWLEIPNYEDVISK